MHVRIEFEDAFVERSTQNCTFDLESKMDFEQGPHKNLIFEFDLTFSNSNRSLGFVVTPTQKSHFRILSTVRQLKFFNFENSKSRFGGVGQNWSKKHCTGPRLPNGAHTLRSAPSSSQSVDSSSKCALLARVSLMVRPHCDHLLPLISRFTVHAHAQCVVIPLACIMCCYV